MLHSDIVTTFFQHLLSFQNKMEPVCMINNITIATADDITTLSDDVNIYPVDLSGTINTVGNDLNWWEKCSYFRPIFFSICCQSFWELTHGHWVYNYTAYLSRYKTSIYIQVIWDTTIQHPGVPCDINYDLFILQLLLQLLFYIHLFVGK